MQPDIDLCLSPQVFHNVDPETDLFNNQNLHFWEIWCAATAGLLPPRLACAAHERARPAIACLIAHTHPTFLPYCTMSA